MHRSVCKTLRSIPAYGLKSSTSFRRQQGRKALRCSGLTIGRLTCRGRSSIADLVDYYFKHGWHLRDERARGVPLLLRNDVLVDLDVTPADAMRRNPFYQECIEYCGFKWFAGILIRAGDEHWCMSIQRTPAQGPLMDGDRIHLRHSSTSLSQAATIAQAVGRARLAGVFDAIDYFGRPALAIDRYGSVVQTSASAMALAGEDLKLGYGELWVADPRARDWIRELIEQIRAARSNVEPLRTPFVIRRRDRPDIVVSAIVLSAAVASPFVGGRAILLLDEIGRPHTPDVSALSEAFRLTTAESSLAAIVAGGAGIDEASNQLDRSRETVRSQLKSIYRKTEVRRLSELVALLATLPGRKT